MEIYVRLCRSPAVSWRGERDVKRDPADAARQRRAVALRAAHYTELAAFATNLGCTKLEAQQVANDSLAELVIHQSKPAAVPVINVRAWLYGVARLKIREVFRDRFRRYVLLDDVPSERLIDPHLGPEKHAELTEVFHLVLQLPQNLRDPLLLKTNGFSSKEIAGILGCSVEAVRQRICRARRELYAKLGIDPSTSMSTSTHRRAE